MTVLLYERGQFRPQDSLITSRVLTFYALGILPYAIGVILLRCFYAVQDTVTPFLAEAFNLALYAVAATWLTNRFGIVGLAVTRGLTFYMVTAILLVALSRKKNLLEVDANLLRFALRTALATLVMGVTSWETLHAMRPYFDSGRTPARALVIGCVMAASGGAFLVTSHLLRLQEARQILKTAWDLIPGKLGLKMVEG